MPIARQQRRDIFQHHERRRERERSGKDSVIIKLNSLTRMTIENCAHNVILFYFIGQWKTLVQTSKWQMWKMTKKRTQQ